MTRVAICVGVSSDLTFAAMAAFINFRDIHGTEGFSYLLYSDNFSRKTIQAARNLDFEVSLRRFMPRASSTKLFASKALGQFSPLVLSKFEIFRLVTEFDSVLWLDYDIVITKGLSELLENQSFDLGYMPSGGAISRSFERPPLGLDATKEGISAGLLVARSSIKQPEEIFDRCWRTFEDEFANLILPEQGVFEIVLPGFELEVLQLDAKRYCASPVDEKEDTAIIHTWGQPKFWSGIEDPRWRRYYEIWLGAGGAPFRPFKHHLHKLMRKIRWVLFHFLATLRT